MKADKKPSQQSESGAKKPEYRKGKTSDVLRPGENRTRQPDGRTGYQNQKVKPKVRNISELENSSDDQELREWSDPLPADAEKGFAGKLRKGISWKIKAAAVLVVLICGLLATRMILHPTDGSGYYVDNDADVLDKGNFGTTDDSDKSFAEALSTIREHATTIADALDTYKREGTEGERLRYYNSSGQVAKVLVYPNLSADGVYEEYYYWNEQMFFTYIWSGDEKQYFYYQDGLLIRWIDKDGKVHDQESDNDEYVELGDKYWSNSVVELQQ